MSSVRDEVILMRLRRNVDENVNNVYSRKDSSVSGAVFDFRLSACVLAIYCRE